MDDYESLSHTKWECKYHVVFIPKCRRKALYGQLRKHLGEVFRQLAERRQSQIEEGHLMSDHVHMLISIPPKYAVSQLCSRSGIPSRHSVALPRGEGNFERADARGFGWRGALSETGLSSGFAMLNNCGIPSHRRLACISSRGKPGSAPCYGTPMNAGNAFSLSPVWFPWNASQA